MTANCQVSRHFAADFNLLFTKCQESIEICGFTVEESNSSTGCIVAHAPTSWKSFGEIIEIQIDRNGEVKIKSICVVPTTLIAYGKNQENIQIIFENLDSLLSE